MQVLVGCINPLYMIGLPLIKKYKSNKRYILDRKQFPCLLKCLQVPIIIIYMVLNVATKLFSIVAKRDHSPVSILTIINFVLGNNISNVAKRKT